MKNKQPMVHAVKQKTAANNIRQIKVYPFYRANSLSKANRPMKIVPHIRLCGCWLTQAGFMPNENITVTVSNGMLVIKNVPMSGKRKSILMPDNPRTMVERSSNNEDIIGSEKQVKYKKRQARKC